MKMGLRDFKFSAESNIFETKHKVEITEMYSNVKTATDQYSDQRFCAMLSLISAASPERKWIENQVKIKRPQEKINIHQQRAHLATTSMSRSINQI